MARDRAIARADAGGGKLSVSGMSVDVPRLTRRSGPAEQQYPADNAGKDRTHRD